MSWINFYGSRVPGVCVVYRINRRTAEAVSGWPQDLLFFSRNLIFDFYRAFCLLCARAANGSSCMRLRQTSTPQNVPSNNLRQNACQIIARLFRPRSNCTKFIFCYSRGSCPSFVFSCSAQQHVKRRKRWRLNSIKAQYGLNVCREFAEILSTIAIFTLKRVTERDHEPAHMRPKA